MPKRCSSAALCSLKASTANGAVLRTMAHGSGQALVFPETCTGTGCPRLVLKTPSFRMKELVDRVTELHPYEVPEVVALRVEEGNTSYLDWVVGSVY